MWENMDGGIEGCLPSFLPSSKKENVVSNSLGFKRDYTL